jgi:hypothetical protein
MTAASPEAIDPHEVLDAFEKELSAVIEQMPPQAVATALHRVLGKTISSFLTNNRVRERFVSWAEGRAEVPEEFVTNLRRTLYIFRLVERGSSADEARGFVYAASLDFVDEASELFLSENRLELILAAARAYIHNDGGY